MRKRRIGRRPQQTPAIAGPDGAARGVHPVERRSHQRHVGLALEDCVLASQPLRVRDVVGVHAGDERCPAGAHGGIAAADETQTGTRPHDAQACITGGQRRQHLARAIRRRIVHDDELEVRGGLPEDAAHGGLEVGRCVADGHHDRQRRNRRHERRILYCYAVTVPLPTPFPFCVALALVVLTLTPSPASAQLASRPAADWIPTLDNPARQASMKIPDVIAALKIQPGETVADVGAGSGVLTGPLAKATGASGVLYASDIDPGLLTHIAQRMQADGVTNVRTVLGSFTDPKLPTPVDLAFMNDVLHHVSDRATYVKHLAGYLKPGGRLAVIEFTPEGSPHKGQAELIVTETQTDGWARDAGLMPAERIELYDDRYFVVYRKP